MKTNKGITLVALVITVILLLILAGIAVSYAIGNRGIISNAQLAKKKAEIAQILETLELEKVNLVNEKSFNITLGQYMEHITKKGIIKENDPNNQVIDNWNIEYGSCYIKVDEKYYFKIEDDEKHMGNLQITYVEKLLLVKLEETIEGTTLKVVVTPKEGTEEIKEYEYYIKQTGELKEKKETNETGEYTYTGLKSNQDYWIEVKVLGENGEQVRLGKWITTEKDRGEPRAIISISGDNIQDNLPVKVYANVKHEDDLSKIKIEACRYVINKESEEIGLNEDSYTGGRFTSEEERIELTLNAIADWYLHVLTVDEADNKKETIQKITVREKYHTHIDINGTNRKSDYKAPSSGGCFTKSNTHTHVASCYKTCSISAGYGYYNTGDDIGTCGCGSKHRVYRYIGYRNHSSCGIGTETLTASSTACSSYKKQIPAATTHQYVACGKTNATKEYLLNCGKTETTLEEYEIEY